MGVESLRQLAARLKRDHATVWRWTRHGITVRGRRVILAATRIGGQLTVSAAQWEAFERDCNPDARPLPESPAAAAKRGQAERRAALRMLRGNR